MSVYDVLGASPDAAIRHAVQIPLIDPMPLLPAMAATDRPTLMLKLKVVLMLLLPEEHPQARALLDSTLRDLVVLWR